MDPLLDPPPLAGGLRLDALIAAVELVAAGLASRVLVGHPVPAAAVSWLRGPALGRGVVVEVTPSGVLVRRAPRLLATGSAAGDAPAGADGGTEQPSGGRDGSGSRPPGSRDRGVSDPGGTARPR